LHSRQKKTNVDSFQLITGFLAAYFHQLLAAPFYIPAPVPSEMEVLLNTARPPIAKISLFSKAMAARVLASICSIKQSA